MPTLTLAVVPSVTPGDSRDALAALCDRLSGLLEMRVRGVHPASYGDLTSELEKDRVQFAWTPPVLLTLSDEQFRLRPLLSAVRANRTDYRAALFVAADGPITGIEDLAGTRVAWVDPSSAAGYFYPRLQLAAQGIDPQGLFREELFLRSYAEVVRAVFDGRADVGATYAERPEPGQPVVRAGFLDVAPERPARVLLWTRPIPNDVIAGHGLLPKTLHQRFSEAVLTLCDDAEGRALLYGAFHAAEFIKTPRRALRQVEDLVSLARTHGLLLQL